MNDSVEIDSATLTHYLIHDSQVDEKTCVALGELVALERVPWADREIPPAGARVVLSLPDEFVRELAPIALEREWEICLLPHPDARQSMAAMGVRADADPVALMQHYLNAPVITVDALLCNDELVFSSVVIGEVLALRPQDINKPLTRWTMLRGALQGLTELSLTAFSLVTGKERKVRLAALGVVVFAQTQSALVERAFVEDQSVANRQLTALALAPRSVFSYLLFLLRLLLPRKISLAKAPGSLSVIITDRLHLSVAAGTQYLLDGKPVASSEIDFVIPDEQLRLLPGPSLVLRRAENQVRGKETVKLNHIPVEEAARPLVDTHLPLFTHATEEEYRELFVALRNNAKVTPAFQVLMVLSVVLAVGGLYANSAPVIIGAMILAPFMSPIVSLAMALARTDVTLIRSAVQTLSVGVLWGLLCAILLAWFIPLDLPTAEMKARMSPTLLDLLVAVVSGVAGAYAHAKEDIAKSLAGVAIAVALVPPLSVMGIGLGWGDWAMAWGAALLLITNTVGIALAGSATFLVLGFAPFKRARAGVGVTLLLMLLISVPLTLSFFHLVKKDHILEHVPTGNIQLAGMEVHVRSVQVLLESPILVRVDVSAQRQLDAAHVDELKAVIVRRVGEPIVLEVQSSIRR